MKRAEAGLDRIDPRAALVVALAASGILLLVWLSHLSFFGDDWDPLLYRRGFSLDVLLRPHAEHILLDAKLGGHELQVGDVDGDGDIDIVSKAWGCLPWNALGGRMHVDYLENKTK